ncbi:MAG TPA: site-specific integrase [Rhabdochlamydiaceae bacterium]|nr:site-specific integrase [Rhabdochlamydiaceae bacterium]
MASIYKRKNQNGTTVWRAVVRVKGHPTVCDHFDRKQEAEDWAKGIEREIKRGEFKFDQHGKTYTFAEVVERFGRDGMLDHHRSKEDTARHLDYWKQRLGGYGLVHLTTDFISKERQVLIETPTAKGKKRTGATVNRYMSSLSSSLSYAVKQLKWMSENPCFSLVKLKENPGRDRVLTEEELFRLLDACKESKSPYLYCIVLIAVTTGARQGEILNLEWSHIDFKNKLAFLKETKNGKPRSIFLSDLVITELEKLFQTRQPQKTLVFASRTAFGKIDIKKAWKEALKRAQITGFVAHGLRHTFATLAASQGASNLELATAMGHRTLEMLQKYTHLDVRVTKKFSNQISSQIMKGEPS